MSARFLAAALAALLAAPGTAQPAQPPASARPALDAPRASTGPARRIVAGQLGRDFTVGQAAVLNRVAHARAADLMCPRLDPDDGAVRAALDAVMAEAGPAPDDAARGALRDRTLVGFGMLVGLALDEAARDRAGFCAAAEADMRRDGARPFLRPAAR